jgi:hypothetical protein
MRRLLFLLIACGLLGSVAGCNLTHTHGICDCDIDDHCLERAPWLRTGVPSVGETVPLPSKLPDGKKKDL